MRRERGDFIRGLRGGRPSRRGERPSLRRVFELGPLRKLETPSGGLWCFFTRLLVENIPDTSPPDVFHESSSGGCFRRACHFVPVATFGNRAGGGFVIQSTRRQSVDLCLSTFEAVHGFGKATCVH